MIDELIALGPGEVLSGIFEAWSRRDKAATIAYFAPDATYRMLLPTDLLPFGGETTGRASISDRLQTILDVFDTVSFSGTIGTVVGYEIQGTAYYVYRHKLTAEQIEGSFRCIAVVRDGQLQELTEIHDVERVRAFMRLVAETAARGNAPDAVPDSAPD